MRPARSMAACRSLRAIVTETAVSAWQRSPSTSCATRSSSVESTPPEKQTRADSYPARTSRNRACLFSMVCSMDAVTANQAVSIAGVWAREARPRCRGRRTSTSGPSALSPRPAALGRILRSVEDAVHARRIPEDRQLGAILRATRGFLGFDHVFEAGGKRDLFPDRHAYATRPKGFEGQAAR